MPAIDMTATGLNIKNLKNNAGLTTKDIADALGFNTSVAIYKWMRGDSLPTLDNLIILADLLGVTINDIIVIKKNNAAVA